MRDYWRKKTTILDIVGTIGPYSHLIEVESGDHMTTEAL